MIDFRLLGPLEACAGGRAINIGGLKQRALLAMLLLRANQPVPRSVLVHQLWDDHPPAGAHHSLEVYISRLRKALDAVAEEPAIVTRPGAYLLRIAAEQLDVNRFERLAREGRQALAANGPEQAAANLRAALALWRGAPLGDLGDEPFARAEIARLEELRIGVIEDRIEADLALGRHADVVVEIEAHIAAHPWRERLHQQLMIALYRCGRQAEALAIYQSARRTLVAELGIEPGRELQGLQQAILRQDACLDPPPRPGPSPQPVLADGGVASLAGLPRSRRLLAGAGLAVSLALFITGALNGPARSGLTSAGPNTVAVIDGSRSVLGGVVAGGGRPNGVAYGDGAAWITDSADDLLLQVDQARRITDRIPVGHGPAGVAVGDGEIWVANELDGTVSEVNPRAGTVVATIRVGNGPDAIGFGFGSVWVASVTDGTLSRVSPASGRVIAAIPLGGAPAGLAIGAQGIWVTSADTGRLLLVDPDRNRVSRAFAVGGSPGGVAMGAGSVWVADSSGTVMRFDPLARRARRIRVSGSPAGLAYADGAVWVADGRGGSVTRIDPQTGATRLVHVGNNPTDLAAAGNDVWATVLPSLAVHRGGTLTAIAQADHSMPTDPAVAYLPVTWQMLAMTNDGLVGYRRVGGLAGDTLVADLATTLPEPADGGKTYLFKLRSSITYSDGTPVRPEDFRRAIE